MTIMFKNMSIRVAVAEMRLKQSENKVKIMRMNGLIDQPDLKFVRGSELKIVGERRKLSFVFVDDTRRSRTATITFDSQNNDIEERELLYGIMHPDVYKIA